MINTKSDFHSVRLLSLILRLLFAQAVALALSVTPAAADTPLGWVNSKDPSAYTTTAGEFEISVGALAINELIDVFDYRADILASSSRLVGDSGYLKGSNIELNYGVTRDLSVFYRRQDHALTLDLGEIQSATVVDIDDSLDTTMQTGGVKWTFFRSNLLNSDYRQSALSLELSYNINKTDDYKVVISQMQLENLQIFFQNPQTFAVDRLEDEGWKTRLVYSMPIGNLSVASIWASYGQSEASSGTSSDLQSATFARLFEQSFEQEETYVHLGASLHYNLTPRLPLLVSYEYVNIADESVSREPATPSSSLPSFLSQSNQQTVSDNHTLFAQVSYWVTPDINLSISGNLYANQFTGTLPHYNNPLSGSFADAPYGYARIQLAYKF